MRDRFRVSEWIIYCCIWVSVIAYPLFAAIHKSSTGLSLDWGGVISSWISLIPFLVLFIIHSLIIVPKLLFKRGIWGYLIAVICLMTPFIGYENITMAPMKRDMERRIERGIERPEHRPFGPERHLPPRKGEMRKHPMPFFMPTPLLLNIVMALLILGFNNVIALLFRHYSEEDKNRELAKFQAEHELTYLKAQINPHFFMNVLNNIHGMVSIDPERAEDMILDLSHLMRYVLYDSSSRSISLSKELEFIENYVNLMSQRYAEGKVAITMNMPSKEEAKHINLPPLLFLVFIENAFKHGVSYKEHSFIKIELTIESNDIAFVCVNSCPTAIDEKHHGVGLSNIRQRLSLLYGKHYTLNIGQDGAEYKVKLVIPLDYDKVHCN